MGESQPFTVPFRPYDWASYPAPALRPQLVQDGLRPALELDRAYYRDRALGEDACGDYGRHALLFTERNLHGSGHRAEAQSDLLCSSLMLGGAYKCIKCSKVRMGDPRASAQPLLKTFYPPSAEFN